MNRRKRSKTRAKQVAAELFDDDGVDPRTAFARRAERDDDRLDRKSLQAARVAQRAIEAALIECADPSLDELEVVSVEPQRGAARLEVVVRVPIREATVTDLSQIHERLVRLRGFLRARIASDLRRRKVPELAITVVPAEKEGR